jgi:CRISPR type III-B/RAMP module-associated protein Cmr5
MTGDLERLRAKRAWECVANSRGQKFADNYSQEAQGFPVDILSNGLLQTLAFYKLGGDDATKMARKRLAEDLGKWLLNEGTEGPAIPFPKNSGDIIQNLMACPREVYRQATLESLSFLQWLKRFSKIEE